MATANDMNALYHLRRIGPHSSRSPSANIIHFNRNVTLIGRHPESDFVLHARNYEQRNCISRRHARVVRIQATHKLHDDSRNGVYVNNYKIEGSVTLIEGDTVTFGHPNGGNVEPGTRVRQPDSEHQFLFESCDCGSSLRRDGPPRRGSDALKPRLARSQPCLGPPGASAAVNDTQSRLHPNTQDTAISLKQEELSRDFKQDFPAIGTACSRALPLSTNQAGTNHETGGDLKREQTMGYSEIKLETCELETTDAIMSIEYCEAAISLVSDDVQIRPAVTVLTEGVPSEQYVDPNCTPDAGTDSEKLSFCKEKDGTESDVETLGPEEISISSQIMGSDITLGEEKTPGSNEEDNGELTDQTSNDSFKDEIPSGEGEPFSLPQRDREDSTPLPSDHETLNDDSTADKHEGLGTHDEEGIEHQSPEMDPTIDYERKSDDPQEKHDEELVHELGSTAEDAVLVSVHDIDPLEDARIRESILHENKSYTASSPDEQEIDAEYPDEEDESFASVDEDAEIGELTLEFALEFLHEMDTFLLSYGHLISPVESQKELCSDKFVIEELCTEGSVVDASGEQQGGSLHVSFDVCGRKVENNAQGFQDERAVQSDESELAIADKLEMDKETDRSSCRADFRHVETPESSQIYSVGSYVCEGPPAILIPPLDEALCVSAQTNTDEVHNSPQEMEYGLQPKEVDISEEQENGNFSKRYLLKERTDIISGPEDSESNLRVRAAAAEENLEEKSEEMEQTTVQDMTVENGTVEIDEGQNEGRQEGDLDSTVCGESVHEGNNLKDSSEVKNSDEIKERLDLELTTAVDMKENRIDPVPDEETSCELGNLDLTLCTEDSEHNHQRGNHPRDLEVVEACFSPSLGATDIDDEEASSSKDSLAGTDNLSSNAPTLCDRDDESFGEEASEVKSGKRKLSRSNSPDSTNSDDSFSTGKRCRFQRVSSVEYSLVPPTGVTVDLLKVQNESDTSIGNTDLDETVVFTESIVEELQIEMSGEDVVSNGKRLEKTTVYEGPVETGKDETHDSDASEKDPDHGNRPGNKDDEIEIREETLVTDIDSTDQVPGILGYERPEKIALCKGPEEIIENERKSEALGNLDDIDTPETDPGYEKEQASDETIGMTENEKYEIGTELQKKIVVKDVTCSDQVPEIVRICEGPEKSENHEPEKGIICEEPEKSNNQVPEKVIVRVRQEKSKNDDGPVEGHKNVDIKKTVTLDGIETHEKDLELEKEEASDNSLKVTENEKFEKKLQVTTLLKNSDSGSQVHEKIAGQEGSEEGIDINKNVVSSSDIGLEKREGSKEGIGDYEKELLVEVLVDADQEHQETSGYGGPVDENERPQEVQVAVEEAHEASIVDDAASLGTRYLGDHHKNHEAPTKEVEEVIPEILTSCEKSEANKVSVGSDSEHMGEMKYKEVTEKPNDIDLQNSQNLDGCQDQGNLDPSGENEDLQRLGNDYSKSVQPVSGPESAEPPSKACEGTTFDAPVQNLDQEMDIPRPEHIPDCLTQLMCYESDSSFAELESNGESCEAVRESDPALERVEGLMIESIEKMEAGKTDETDAVEVVACLMVELLEKLRVQKAFKPNLELIMSEQVFQVDKSAVEYVCSGVSLKDANTAIVEDSQDVHPPSNTEPGVIDVNRSAVTASDVVDQPVIRESENRQKITAEANVSPELSEQVSPQLEKEKSDPEKASSNDPNEDAIKSDVKASEVVQQPSVTEPEVLLEKNTATDLSDQVSAQLEGDISVPENSPRDSLKDRKKTTENVSNEGDQPTTTEPDILCEVSRLSQKESVTGSVEDGQFDNVDDMEGDCGPVPTTGSICNATENTLLSRPQATASDNPLERNDASFVSSVDSPTRVTSFSSTEVSPGLHRSVSYQPTANSPTVGGGKKRNLKTDTSPLSTSKRARIATSVPQSSCVPARTSPFIIQASPPRADVWEEDAIPLPDVCIDIRPRSDEEFVSDSQSQISPHFPYETYEAAGPGDDVAPKIQVVSNGLPLATLIPSPQKALCKGEALSSKLAWTRSSVIDGQPGCTTGDHKTLPHVEEPRASGENYMDTTGDLDFPMFDEDDDDFNAIRLGIELTQALERNESEDDSMDLHDTIPSPVVKQKHQRRLRRKRSLPSFSDEESGPSFPSEEDSIENVMERVRKRSRSSIELKAEVIDDQNDRKEPQILRNMVRNDHAELYVQRVKDIVGQARETLSTNESLSGMPRVGAWVREMTELIEKAAVPRTVIAVVGDTGSGKSFLMNALLGHAAILPTSGMRACTAVVVEIENNIDPYTYEGEIEFLSQEEWYTELQNLLQDLQGVDGFVRARQPDSNLDACVSWSKIRAVYGPFKDKTTFKDLEKIKNVTRMLGKKKTIKERDVNRFRNNINRFIESTDTGSGGQYWPIVKRVKLKIPCSVCSSGAVLVDLPGIQDANAARDKIAKEYLQKSTAVWVVANIQRAVDNKAAKEMLGEQFRRQLLMDGQYGSVSFICTKTDEINSSEMKRSLSVNDKTEPHEKAIDKLVEEDDELEKLITKTEKEIIECRSKLKDLQDVGGQLSHDLDVLTKAKESSPEMTLTKTVLKEQIEETTAAIMDLKQVIKEKRRETEKNKNERRKLDAKNTISILRRRISAICANARSEYAKQQIKADFKAGLKEMKQRAGVYEDEDEDEEEYYDDNDENEDPEINQTAENLKVFCVSSTEYLKIMGCLPRIDGEANVFQNAEDCGIPELEEHVHLMTKVRRRNGIERMVTNLAQMIHDIHAYLTQEGAENARARSKAQALIKRQAELLKTQKLREAVEDTMTLIGESIGSNINRKVQAGSRLAAISADGTVTRWHSKENKQDPKRGGYHWSTYKAVIGHNGAFQSPTRGPIDFNQELAEPMHTSISVEWNNIFNSVILRHLEEFKLKIASAISWFTGKMTVSLMNLGMAKDLLNRCTRVLIQRTQSSLEEEITVIKAVITEQQRQISRVLTPSVQDRMEPIYSECSKEHGSGSIARMKKRLSTSVTRSKAEMFDETSAEMIRHLANLEDQIKTALQEVVDRMVENCLQVYEPIWEANTKSLRKAYVEGIADCVKQAQALAKDAQVTLPMALVRMLESQAPHPIIQASSTTPSTASPALVSILKDRKENISKYVAGTSLYQPAIQGSEPGPAKRLFQGRCTCSVRLADSLAVPCPTHGNGKKTARKSLVTKPSPLQDLLLRVPRIDAPVTNEPPSRKRSSTASRAPSSSVSSSRHICDGSQERRSSLNVVIKSEPGVRPSLRHQPASIFIDLTEDD